MNTIDKTNYKDATEGKFKSIPRGWATLLTTVGMHTPCSIGGRIWHLDHVGYGKKEDHFSGYWISDDEQHLIRISDHWSYYSKRKHVETGVKRCHAIRTCTWSMKQKPHVIEVECPKKKHLKVAGGYIRFDKMKKKVIANQ